MRQATSITWKIAHVVTRARNWARTIKRDAHALYLAARDPRVAWHAKLFAVCVAAYALSPIDLIPDFVPVLGYFDDIIIVPLGIMLAVRMTPTHIMAEHRASAEAASGRPASWGAAVAIVAIWIVAIAFTAWTAWQLVQR